MGNCLSQEEQIHSNLNSKLYSCFIKWHIQCKNLKIKSLRNDLILNSTRSAVLQQQLADTENIIMEMERKVNDFNKHGKQDKVHMKYCCICFNENQNFIEALAEAFTHKGYVLLVLGFFVCGFQITLVGTHVPGYMQDRGLGGWSATIILSLIGLFNIVGTLGIGYLGTKYSKKKLLSALYFLRAVIICIFIFSPPSIYMAIFFVH